MTVNIGNMLKHRQRREGCRVDGVGLAKHMYLSSDTKALGVN